MKKFLLMLVVAILILGCTSLFGQTNIGFNGIGGAIGYAMPSDIDNGLGFGAVADLGTIINPDIAFGADILFWSKKYDEHGWSLSYSQVYITATGKYQLSSGSDFKPYVGAGLGLVFASAKVEFEGGLPKLSKVSDVKGYSSSASDTELCIHALGGFKYKLSDMLTGFAEARYSIGGADTFWVLGGVMYNLTK